MMKLILHVFGLLALFASTAMAQDMRSFEALLIKASNERAPIDRRLEKVEYKLRRMVKFEHFHYAGSAQQTVSLPATFEMDVGGGYTLQIDAKPSGRSVQAVVRWVRGGKQVLRTSVRMDPGAHAILGGDPVSGGTMLVTLLLE